MVRFAACIILLLFSAAMLPAQSASTIRLDIENLAVFSWDGSQALGAGTSSASVDFLSAPSSSVQGRLQMDFNLLRDQTTGALTPYLSLPRASIRFRFPVTDSYSIRITTGRDRLSWGLGSLFKAGDILFGADGSSSADLTQSGDVRDETAWLTAIYFPLGGLGFLETVYLPPLMQIPTNTDPQPILPLDYSRAGLRIHSAVGPVSLETAWLYDGERSPLNTYTSPRNHFAQSIQWNLLGADIYSSAALNIPITAERSTANLVQDYGSLSAGVFRSFSPAYGQSLSARAEILLQPAEDTPWQLYPELIWAPNRSQTWLARAVIREGQSDITLGGFRALYQGFSVVFFAAGSFSDEQDTTFAIAAGIQYQF